MAQLTDQLSSINTGRPIVEPERQSGTSFIGGLSRLAGGLLDANNARNETAARAGERARQAGERTVVNEAAVFINKARAEATAEIRAAGEDRLDVEDVLQMPQDITDEARALRRQKRAVQQGRMSQDALDLKLEKFILTSNNKYPEHAEALGKFMKEQGFDHYLWREQELVDAQEVGADAAIVKGFAKNVQDAVEAGYGNMGLSQEQLYRAGVGVNEAKLKAEAAQKAAAEYRAAAGEQRTEADWLKRRADEASVGALTAQANGQLGALNDHLQNLIKAADTDDAAYERLSGLQDDVDMLITRYGNHFVQQAQAVGASREAVENLREDIDRHQKAIKDIYFGSSSRFAQRNRAYTNMQSELGLATEKALPFYMWAKRVMGPAAVEAIFDGTAVNALSPEVKSKIRKELMSWDPTKKNEGLDLMAEIGMLSKGTIQLADIPEERLTGDHMRGLNATVKRSAEHIMDPEPDDASEHTTFLNSLGNLSIAGIRFTPGTKDLKALDYTIDTVTNQKNLVVLGGMLKESSPYRDKAIPVFAATRQAAANVLETARTVLGKDERALVTLTSSGVFVPKKTKASNAPGLMDEGGMSGAWGAKDFINPDAQKQADIMNKATAYLVDTASFDPELRGYSRAELFQHYAGGVPLKPKTEGGKPPKELNAQIDSLEREIGQMNETIEEDMPFRQPASNDLVGAVIHQESGGRAGIEGPQTKYGTAQGLMQVLPSTGKAMAAKLNIEWKPELMTAKTKEGAEYQKQIGEAYLNEGLAKYDGNIEKALMYYHGGPDESLWGPKTRNYAKSILARMNRAQGD